MIINNSITYVPSLFPKANCAEDFDGDSNFNHQDFDADGDNCPDALEGLASIEFTQLTTQDNLCIDASCINGQGFHS